MKAFEVVLKLAKECFKQLKGGSYRSINSWRCHKHIHGMVGLKIKLEDERIILKLYSRYVDDGNIVIKSDSNSIGNSNEQQEQEIMEKLKDVANSIHESISVKVDYQSYHENQRLPILDTQMRIKKVEISGTKKHQILYSYYEKKMSRKYLIYKNSAQ